MYLAIDFLHAYLSVTPHVPYFEINRSLGVKKEKKILADHKERIQPLWSDRFDHLPVKGFYRA